MINSLNRLASQALLRPNGVLAAVAEVSTINVHLIPRPYFNFRRHFHALKTMANPGDKIVEVQEVSLHLLPKKIRYRINNYIRLVV